MHARLRVFPLLFVVTVACVLCAQTERPPLFAPDFIPADEVRPAPSTAGTSVPAKPLSERVRSMVNDAAKQMLEQVAVFDAPASSGGPLLITPGGATVMAPMIVREKSLREDQVRPRQLRLYHFTPEPPDSGRRIAGGATASLFHTYIGGKEFQIDLSIFNLAGKGIEHNIDFSRVEIAFRCKW